MGPAPPVAALSAISFGKRPRVGRAAPAGAEPLVSYNRAIARETEGVELRKEVISAGVAAIPAKPELGFYTVAEFRGKVVG